MLPSSWLDDDDGDEEEEEEFMPLILMPSSLDKFWPLIDILVDKF